LKNIYLFLILIVGMLLQGCNEAPKDPLRIASSPWPGYEPLYLARDLGYLKEDKVDLFELPSSDINMESFRNHSADLSTLTLDEALTLINDGIKLRIVAIMDISHGGDAVLAHPSIKKLSDIKGKRIAIMNIPLGLYMLKRLLDKAGVDRKDVTVYPMSEDKQVDFYKAGKADVVITFDPIKTRLEKVGAKVIFDSSQIPNEIFDIVMVHEDTYLKRRDDVCYVVNGWFKALDYLKAQPADAHKRMSKRLAVKPEEVPAMMEGIILPTRAENKKILGGEKPGLLEPAQRLAEILYQDKRINSMVDISKVIDTSFTSCY
jgi:NitT/TauT family transport system substrate-binding protein